jgi:hypothetical protein
MPRLDRRSRWILGALLAAGLVLRVGWGVFIAEPPASGGCRNTPQGCHLHDPVLYQILAGNIAGGDGYSYGPGLDQGETAFYPPGYPMTIGALEWVVDKTPFNPSPFGQEVGLNIVLSVATIAAMFELGRRLVSPTVGLIAAGLFAFWPNLIVYSGVPLTETLFLLLFTLMLLVALASPEVVRAPGRWRMVTTGVLFGALVMVRPTSIVVAPLFVLLWWRVGLATAVKRAALVGAASLLLILPWTARNFTRMDSFVLISTNMGDNMCIGNHPGATGAYEVPPYCNLGTQGDASEQLCLEPDPAKRASLPSRCRRPEVEIIRQDDNVDLALKHIREEPLGFFTKMPAKLRWTLDRDTDGLWAATDYGQQEPLSPKRMDLVELITNGYYAVVGVVSLAGVALLLVRQDAARRRLFFIGAALIQLVPPLVTFGDARFKMPIYPAMAVAAAVAVVAALQRRMPDPDVIREWPSADPQPEAETTAAAQDPEIEAVPVA